MLRQLGQQLRRVGLSYNAAALKRPQTTAIVTTVVKTSAADAFAQLVGACGGFLHGSWAGATHACARRYHGGEGERRGVQLAEWYHRCAIGPKVPVWPATLLGGGSHG